MRVLLVNHAPLSGLGSGYTMTCLAEALQADGHQVEAFVGESQRGASAASFPVSKFVCNPEDSRADLPFHLPCFTVGPRIGMIFSEMSDEQIAAYRETFRQALLEVVERFQPDVIHCMHAWLEGNLALETGVPYFLSAGWKNIACYLVDERFRLWTDQAVENAAGVLASSRFMTASVCDLFSVDPNVVHLASEPIRTLEHLSSTSRGELFDQLGLEDSGGPLVVFAGQLLPAQGVETVLGAAQLYEKLIPGVTTVVVGDGPKFTEYEQTARRLRLRRTYFHACLNVDESLALLAVADLCLIPAPAEPLVPFHLYSMAAGTPVVVCDAGGLGELVDDEVGFVLPGANAELAAHCVRNAIEGNWKAHKGPRALQRMAQRHDPVDFARTMVKLYRQALARRGFPVVD